MKKNNATVNVQQAEAVEKHVKEPLIHITKRTNVSWQYAIGLRAGAILCAFVVMAILFLVLAKENRHHL